MYIYIYIYIVRERERIRTRIRTIIRTKIIRMIRIDLHISIIILANMVVKIARATSVSFAESKWSIRATIKHRCISWPFILPNGY